MENSGRKILQIKWSTLVLAILLIVQLGLIVFYGSQKVGFHEDEIYMFEFANNPVQYIRNTENYYGTWRDGDFYRNAIIPSAENRFDYGHIFQNAVGSKIYLCILHTLGSLFPQIELKWIGLFPNLVFCLISTVLLYCISTTLFENKFGLIVAFAWVVSIGSLTSAMLIRPYVLFTDLTLGFVYLHIQTFNQSYKQTAFRSRTLILLLLCTLFGILTHYYFLVICFFICGLFAFYLVGTKKYKLLRQYVLTEFGALLVLVILSPSVLSIFSSDLGKKTLQELNRGKDTWEKIKITLSTTGQNVWNGWILEFLVIMAAIAAAVFLNRYVFRLLVTHEPGNGILIRRTAKVDVEWCVSYNMIIVLALVVMAVGYTLIIAKVAIWQAERYYFCTYPFILLVMCTLLYQLFRLLLKHKTMALILTLCVVCTVSAMGFLMQNVNYLYRDFVERNEELSVYKEYPVIVMSITPTTPERFIPEYMEHQDIYRSKNGRYNGIAHAAETMDISGGFLLYVFNYKDTDEELFQKIRESYPVNTYNLIANQAGSRVFFCE